MYVTTFFLKTITRVLERNFFYESIVSTVCYKKLLVRPVLFVYENANFFRRSRTGELGTAAADAISSSLPLGYSGITSIGFFGNFDELDTVTDAA